MFSFAVIVAQFIIDTTSILWNESASSIPMSITLVGPSGGLERTISLVFRVDDGGNAERTLYIVFLLPNKI